MRILLVLLFICSYSAFAKDVEGTITYKLPSGDLVSRDVILNVPSRGQGEVVLSGKSFEWKSKKFKSYTIAGQTIFAVAFTEKFRGIESTTLLKGTYLKGKNQIIYIGDVYKAKAKNKKFKHSGVFRFEYLR